MIGAGRVRTAGPLVAALLLGATRASATPKDTCIKNFEESQVYRQQSRLVEAQDALRVCARSDCPALVSAKCAEWLAEVDRALPTVVFGAQADGVDTADVRVLERGTLLSANVDGRAIPMNPGEHLFRFEHAGSAPVERTVVLREGEKRRAVSVAFAAPPRREPPAAVTAAPAPVPASAASGSERRRVPTATWLLGGLGVVALGSFAYFGVSALDRSSTLRDTCAPTCANSDVADIKTKNTISGISLGVALASLGAAAYFFFSAPR